MFSEQHNKDTILERLLEKIPDNVDKSEGSFVYDLLSTFSSELEQMYINLDIALETTFASTSYGEYLDMRTQEFGVYRKEGVKANNILRFSGNDGVVIPAGTLVETDGGLQYVTLEEGVIEEGKADVRAEAVEVGREYNVPADAITELNQNVAGVTSVTNPYPFSNGVDRESDEELKNRFLLTVQTPATSGNASQYKIWALEVNGVGDAKVYPIWNGAGTVKVVCISDLGEGINTEKEQEVFEHIESVRPIGATVTVKSADEVPININVKITKNIESELSDIDVEDNIRDSVREYLRSIAFKQNYVSYALIGNAIIDSEGVLDYSDLTVNGGVSNIAVGDEEVAVLGDVSIIWQ